MIYQVISALIAVYFSCIVFEAPKRLLIHISIIGGIGWFVYLAFFVGDVEKGKFFFGQTMITAGMIALAIFTVDSIFRLYSHWQSSRRQSTN